MSEISPLSLKLLTGAFSERLRDAIPVESAVRVSPWEIESKLDALINQPGILVRNLSLAAMSIPSSYQDHVIRDLKRGWPSSGRKDRTGVCDSGVDLPRPEVEIVTGELRLWYGEKENPALELRSIHLEELDVRSSPRPGSGQSLDL